MAFKPGDTFEGWLTTATFATGATNADSLPIGALKHNGATDGAVPVTVTAITAGVYRLTGTLGAYSSGDRVSLVATFPMGGLVFNETLWTNIVDTKRVGDLNDAAAAPTSAAVADAVWDEAIAGHVAAGSTGQALSAAGAAGDPWLGVLPGAYVAGTAGYIIGNLVTLLGDAVWEEALVDHLTTGTSGKALSDMASASTPTCGSSPSFDCSGPLGGYSL